MSEATKPPAWAMERAEKHLEERYGQTAHNSTMAAKALAAVLDGVWQERGGDELMSFVLHFSRRRCDNEPRLDCMCVSCMARAALAKARPAASEGATRD